tara:strand:- start:261 stop:914 length:654 start_codon:yes stop_codon:yes gene_type:complete
MQHGNESTTMRNLAKRHIFTRYNDADIIIDKVIKNNKSRKMLSEIVGPQTPFGLHTNFWDKDKPGKNDVEVYTSKGLTYTSKNNVTSGRDLIDLYKVIFSKATSEHAGQADKSGKRRIFSKIEIIKPNTICTQSYLVAGSFKTLKQAKNLSTYLKTRFVRFMLFQALTSQDISREKFCFVPQIDFEKEIKDKELFKTFKLDSKEISIIEKLIKNFDE